MRCDNDINILKEMTLILPLKFAAETNDVMQIVERILEILGCNSNLSLIIGVS
jgi:hypothetical protein